ncbi:hypothetical protein N7517_002736 [Penicillium concentricum]|uniref:Uncharacterized protein n=1 Tax=Penicillium concentricum TaxID=293559 RepID=A0A9W9SV99_9EURO|nr:uncharacterized protein N7517_002736 [Penicillium concentricum]KAJ5384825.1 hypothetical protein N7517_002736 [Penicillium concentricum]
MVQTGYRPGRSFFFYYWVATSLFWAVHTNLVGPGVNQERTPSGILYFSLWLRPNSSTLTEVQLRPLVFELGLAQTHASNDETEYCTIELLVNVESYV